MSGIPVHLWRTQRRHVSRLHARGAQGDKANELKAQLFDALRCASFPGIPPGSIVRIRKLDLGKVDLRNGFMAISRKIDELIRELGPGLVHGVTVEVDAASGVWFAHHEEALLEAVYSIVQDPKRSQAWHWPKVFPWWSDVLLLGTASEPLWRELDRHFKGPDLLRMLIGTWHDHGQGAEALLRRADPSFFQAMEQRILASANVASPSLSLAFRTWWNMHGEQRVAAFQTQRISATPGETLIALLILAQEDALQNGVPIIDAPTLAALAQEFVHKAKLKTPLQPGEQSATTVLDQVDSAVTTNEVQPRMQESALSNLDTKIDMPPEHNSDSAFSFSSADGEELRVSHPSASPGEPSKTGNGFDDPVLAEQRRLRQESSGWTLGTLSHSAGFIYSLGILREIGWESLVSAWEAHESQGISIEILRTVGWHWGIAPGDSAVSWLDDIDSAAGIQQGIYHPAQDQRLHDFTAPGLWIEILQSSMDGNGSFSRCHTAEWEVICLDQIPVAWAPWGALQSPTWLGVCAADTISPDLQGEPWQWLKVLLAETLSARVHSVYAGGVQALVHRPGLFLVGARHLDVTMPLDGVEVAIRMTGWDLDPGWVSYLGQVVHFHYQDLPGLAVSDD